MAVYRAYASILIDADSEEEAIERALRIYDSKTFDYVELEDEDEDEGEDDPEYGHCITCKYYGKCNVCSDCHDSSRYSYEKL